MGQDSPGQFSQLVSAIFACQKLSISIDCLALDSIEQSTTTLEYEPKIRLDREKGFGLIEQRPKFGAEQDYRLLQQAAELTSGLYLRVPF